MSKLGFSAPRREITSALLVLSSFDDSISRLQRFLDLTLTLTWGVAPGYYISRRWHWFADFCSKAVQSQCQRWLNRSFTKKSDVLVRDERDRLASKSGAAFHSHWASARWKDSSVLRNRFNGFHSNAQKPLKRFLLLLVVATGLSRV